MNVRFNFSPIFSPVFETKRQIIDIVGGRGRGGSHFGTDYFLFNLISNPYFRGCFLRRVQGDVRDSLFQDFKDRIEEKQLPAELFRINENEMRISYIPSGNIIISKGVVKDGGRTAKLKSLAGFTHVLIEEADEIEEADFNQLIDSLRTTKVKDIQVLRLFNPPGKTHWFWHSYNLSDEKVTIDSHEENFYSFSPKSTSDIEMVFSTYLDNYINLNSKTISRYKNYKSTNPNYYYTTIMGLISSGTKGRVYSNWKTITEAQFKDLECNPVYVVDFGYDPDPTAVMQVKWKDNKRYVKELIYEKRLDDIGLAKLMLDKGITYKDLIIVDSGNGGIARIANYLTGGQGTWSIFEGYEGLRKGFSMQSAVKGAGSIKSGIKQVQSTEVYITESSSNTWEEYDKYVWAKDRYGNSTGIPIDDFNHTMDCIRYFELYKAVNRI